MEQRSADNHAPGQPLIYQRRPLTTDLTDTTLSFIEIMNTITAPLEGDWSFVGGFPRDLYLGESPNDYDVCAYSGTQASDYLYEMGLTETQVSLHGEVPHDHFINPYGFDKTPLLIHWIPTEDRLAYAPEDFDFTINQIALKSDGYFYAPTQTWQDVDAGIVRKNTSRSTANIAVRAIRFACKYGFQIEASFQEEIKQLARGDIDTFMFKANLEKMQDESSPEQVLEMLRAYGFPRAHDFATLAGYIQWQDDLILSGNAYRDPARSRYF